MASISTPPINFSTKHTRFSSLYLSPNRVSPNNVVLKSRSLVSRVSCLASLLENHKSVATIELSSKVLKFSGLSLPLRRRGSIGLLVPAAAGVKTSIFNGVFQICRGQLTPVAPAWIRPCLESHNGILPLRPSPITVAAATTTTTESKSIPNKLAIESQLIPLPSPPQAIEPQLVPPPPPQPTLVTPSDRPVPNDPSLKSTWTHRAWVASGCTVILISLAKSIIGAVDSHIWVEPILAGVVGYVLADLGSGVYHWAMDNYGDASTPIFGAQIEAFKGHHRWPWSITRCEFANIIHTPALMITFVVLPFDLICDNDPILQAFVGVWSGSIMFSLQFHAWAHGTKSRLPALVVALQDAGILLSRRQHLEHHQPPYNNNYCIVSGVWNKFLEKHEVFEALEMVLFSKLGVRPRSWSEPGSEWTEQTAEP